MEFVVWWDKWEWLVTSIIMLSFLLIVIVMMFFGKDLGIDVKDLVAENYGH